MLQLWHHPPTHTPLPLRAPITPPHPVTSLSCHISHVSMRPHQIALATVELSSSALDEATEAAEAATEFWMGRCKVLLVSLNPILPICHTPSLPISHRHVFSQVCRGRCGGSTRRGSARDATGGARLAKGKPHTASLTLHVSHCMSHTAFLPPLVCSTPNSMCLILTMTYYYYYYSDHDRRL